MKKITVYHYDAFTTEPDKGNPAGVVLDADGLTDEEMQNIAYQMGFNETTFVWSSDEADLALRFFTPGQEMALCGHGMLATLFALKTKGLLPNKKEFVMATNSGFLPISFVEKDEPLNVRMTQAYPEFKAFEGSLQDVASALGIEVTEIDSSLPTVYGSTGNWTLIVPVKQLKTFEKMQPKNAKFPHFLTAIPKASLHPICLETYHEAATLHGRHFSSPFSGTVEDPVTGTASGVMGAYYTKFIQSTRELIVEQGQEIGKDGLVTVYIGKTGDISISGTAVYVSEKVVSL